MPPIVLPERTSPAVDLPDGTVLEELVQEEVIADDIAGRGEDYEVRVEGHTDDVPTSAYADNQELSEDHPRADNGTDEGRAQNRRVVITVSPAS